VQEAGTNDPDSIVHHLRFPSLEFRSLCLNPLGKSNANPFPDKGTWNRHKVALAHLVLLLDAGEEDEFQARLSQLVESTIERDTHQLARAQCNSSSSEEQLARLKGKLEARRAKVRQQFEGWVRTTVNSEHLTYLRPVLQAVLEVEPAPLSDTRRDGTHTETAIAGLLQRELPPGWRLYGQARVTGVDGEVFKNVKMLKGEADMLIVDPHGIVQAIVEIKTAKGNPYLALYEDVTRFTALYERVRGRLVTFTPSYLIEGGEEGPVTTVFQNAPSTLAATATNVVAPDGRVIPASQLHAELQAAQTAATAANVAARVASSKAASAASSSVAAPGPAECSGSDSEASSRSSSPSSSSSSSPAAPSSAPSPTCVTLRFSKAVRPVYMLGSAIAPEDLGPVVRSAQSKLLTMEFGRVLSTQIDAWRDVSLVELTPVAAVLQVPEACIPQCTSAVRRYFENLKACDIFMVPGV